MIKVQITKQGIVTNSATFNSQEEADTWLLLESQNGSFGKAERWVDAASGEDIQQAIATRQVEVSAAVEEILSENNEILQEASEAIYKTEYQMPAEFIVEISDISTQLQQETRNAKLKQLRALRDAKLLEVDVMVNELVLDLRSDKAAVVAYREALLAFTEDYRWANDPNKAKVAIDDLDLNNIIWPSVP